MTETREEALLRGYLLGELSDAERSALEEQWFDDDAKFWSLAVAEADIVDAYSRGTLSDVDRRRFEAMRETRPALRQRVEFARAFATHVAPQTGAAVRSVDQRRPLSRLGFMTLSRPWRAAVAATLVAAVISAWALMSSWRAGGRPVTSGQTSGGSNPETQSTTPAPTVEAGRNAVPTSTVFAVLAPGLVRGGEAALIEVSRTTSTVRLQLNLQQDEYPNGYSAQLHGSDGRRVWAQDGLLSQPESAGGRAILIEMDAALLEGGGEYTLRLNGRTSDNQSRLADAYAFRVAIK